MFFLQDKSVSDRFVHSAGNDKSPVMTGKQAQVDLKLLFSRMVQAASGQMITEKISVDAKSAKSQRIMMFNKTMQDWQTKMSCDMMDMIQRGKIDTTGVSEELKRVCTQLSEELHMLHKNTMELQSKFAMVEAEKNQLREHVQQGSQ